MDSESSTLSTLTSSHVECILSALDVAAGRFPDSAQQNSPPRRHFHYFNRIFGAVCPPRNISKIHIVFENKFRWDKSNKSFVFEKIEYFTKSISIVDFLFSVKRTSSHAPLENMCKDCERSGIRSLFVELWKEHYFNRLFDAVCPPREISI